MVSKKTATKRRKASSSLKKGEPDMDAGTDTNTNNVGTDPELVAKVASHERDIVNLTSSVQSLSETLETTADAQWRAIREQGETLRAAIQQQGVEVRNDISSLGAKFSESRAVNWPLIVTTAVAGLTFTSLAITILVLLGSMALDPVSARLDRHIAATPPDRVTALDGRTEAMKVQTNLMHQQSFLLINLTRQEAGLEPFDQPNYWPPLQPARAN